MINTLKLKSNDNDIDIAARILKSGKLVGIPTETVYGLAANALDKDAVANIFKVKGRAVDNPLIVHISNISEIYKLVSKFPANAQKLANYFWPGPLTMILKKSNIIPYEVSCGLDTVAIRMPLNVIARKLIKKVNLPLAAPSANLSGKPSPTSFLHVLNDFDGKIDAILDGGDCTIGIESTVITLESKIPKILRPGSITPEQISDVLGKVEIDDCILRKVSKNRIVSSPGMKYKHYAPKAKVIIVNGSSNKYIDFVNLNANDEVGALCFDEDIDKLKVKSVSYGPENDLNVQAQNLFNCLRKIDNENDILIVYARISSKDGMGMALYNRLIRAAGFEIIDV